ncbi:MAG: alpha/beta hydrolase [Myxococcota bacterium]
MNDLTRLPNGQERWIERPDGTRIRTVMGGDGPPTVVFVHGYGAHFGEWNVITESLDDIGWVAFNLRGHGGSTIGTDGVDTNAMAEDYKAVLETYDVRNGVLVGHSTGGFLGIRFLLEHPEVVAERLQGCVLVATFAGDVGRANPQNRIQIPLIQSGILVPSLSFRPLARAFVGSLCGDEFDSDYIDGFVQAFRQADHRALVPLLRALVVENDYARLGEITLPCSILVGEKDSTTPEFHADDLHAGIRDSSLQRLPGKGHLLNWEAPKVVVRAIRELQSRVTLSKRQGARPE